MFACNNKNLEDSFLLKNSLQNLIKMSYKDKKNSEKKFRNKIDLQQLNILVY